MYSEKTKILFSEQIITNSFFLFEYSPYKFKIFVLLSFRFFFFYKKTYEQWRYVFYVGSVIFLIAGFFFLIFSSSNIQSWAIEVIDYDDDDDVADNHHSLTDKSFSPTICQINKENIENEHKEFDQIHSNVVSIT